MPQLVKGGKWVFGWVVVGSDGVIRIPPEAFDEYGFTVQEPVVFMRGSRRSGGFNLGRRGKLAALESPILSRAIGQGVVGEGGRVVIPPSVPIKPGDRLLAVRGSGLALGFLIQGPIYEEALRHADIETYIG